MSSYPDNLHEVYGDILMAVIEKAASLRHTSLVSRLYEVVRIHSNLEYMVNTAAPADEVEATCREIEGKIYFVMGFWREGYNDTFDKKLAKKMALFTSGIRSDLWDAKTLYDDEAARIKASNDKRLEEIEIEKRKTA